MPTYDRTGPFGYGPRTGRGFGPCGREFGYGKGFRCVYPRTLTKEEVKKELEEEKKFLQERIKEIEALEKQE